MRASLAAMTLLAGSVIGGGAAFAHDPEQHADSVSGELGTTHFPNSGAAGAQPDFLRGLLLLHSFEYAAARRSFQAAEREDPGFAMAYWGEALTYNHTLWGEQDLGAARAALAKLGATPEERAAKARSARERAYLAAVEQLYGEGDKERRDANFSAALGAVARAYPDDLDARSFYALSIMGLSGSTRNIPNYMRAAAEAEAVYEIDRQHPGALHYLIHAYDDPIHAPLGLRAARRYGKVAAAASHAQHMPSHIFFALGMWDDAIEANMASLKTARAQGEAGYHSLLWLEYAYLQQDKRREAEQLVQSVAHDVAAGPDKDNRARLAHARAMWLVDTRGSEGPEARSSVESSGISNINSFAACDFVRGITAADTPSEARVALEQLRARIENARTRVTGVTRSWLDNITTQEIEQATLMATVLAGTIRYYEGEKSAGIAQIREAIGSADRMVFEYGPPWSVKPFDEVLGELLLADGRREEAAAAFQKTLAVYPNRRLAREGLAASQVIH